MTIAEVSRKYDISQDTLRYYERIGIIPRVERSASGIRNYTEESCGWIELAKCMRSAGVQIEPLIEYCELVQQGDSTIEARMNLLKEERKKIKEKIVDMQQALERLDFKVGRYEEAVKAGTLTWE